MCELAEAVKRFRQSEITSLGSDTKVVGCLGSMVPLELVRACGGRPVRMLQAGRSEDFESAAELMGPDTCPFCRCLIGRSLRKLQPQSKMNVLVVAAHCDQTRRSSELFQRHFHVPVLPIMLPATWEDSSSLQMYQGELGWLGAELGEMTGVGFCKSRLAESVTAYAQAREATGRIVEQLAGYPVLAHQIGCLLGLAEPLRLADFAKSIAERVQLLGEQEKASNSKPTVLIIGSIIGDDDTSLLRAFHGRCRVIQDTCSGKMFLELKIPPADGSAIESLAGAYWQQIPSIRSRPNSRFYEYVEQTLRRCRADAIIYRSLKFCDLWSLEAVRFKQQMSVPVLLLDCTYGPGQDGLMENRVQALLEMLRGRISHE